MANYTNLKSTINAQIKANGTGAITGPVLNGVLRDMVSALGEAGYLYKGVATPATSPGTPDSNVFYIASTAGTYTNFGGAVVADGEVAILKYNGTWTKEVTGAATAAQVTQLGQELEGEVNGMVSIPMTPGFYIKNDQNTGAAVDTSTPVSNNSFSYALIDCQPGDIFILNATGGWGPRPYAFIDSSNLMLDKAGPSTSFTDYKLVAPENAAKLIINTSGGRISYKYLPNALKNNVPTKEDFDSLEERVDTLEDTSAHLEWVCRNLWDGTLLNGYISSSKVTQGETILISSSSTSKYIKLAISPNKDYTVSAANEVKYVAITDENGVLLANVDTRNGYKVKTVSGKANAAYLYVQQNMSGSSSTDLQIEEGSVPTPYDSGHWELPAENIPQEFEKSPIYGKVAAFFGDSICYGSGSGWAAPIASNYGVKSVNKGVSGATLHDRLISGVLSSIRITFEDYAQDNPADYYILSGGFNDSVSDFGDITDGYPEAGDFTTTDATQAIEDMCAYASEHLAGKKIGFIIHYYPSIYVAWNRKADLIVEILNKWSIPCLDLRKCATFGLTNDALRAVYGKDLKTGVPNYDSAAGYALDDNVVYDGAVYKANVPIPSPAGSWDASKWTLTSDDNGYDTMHCNTVAYNILARIIAEWMMTL